MLLICVLDIERRWAQGMNYRQILTNVGQDIKALRYNIKKKFRKCSSEAKKLLETSKIVCDKETIQEAEAYFSVLDANYRIFKLEFEESLKLLKSASEIYSKISKSKDAIEAIAYKEKVESLKTPMRLCQYNLIVKLYFKKIENQQKRPRSVHRRSSI